MTQVQLITGFLGAGKTSLLDRLLPEYIKRGKTAVIENDFGDVGIDSKIISNENVKITELSSGCICCSLFGELLSSLEFIINEVGPDNILIEPSGLSRTSDVLKAAKVLAEKGILELNPSIAIVDVENFTDYIEDFGNFYIDQIERAGLVLLSHCGGHSGNEIKSVWEEIDAINPRAVKIDANWFDMQDYALAALIFTAIEESKALLPDNSANSEQEHCDVHHQAFEAGNYFSSWNAPLTKPMSKAQLSEKLEKLQDGRYGRILRAKGFCPSNDNGIWHFEYLPKHLTVEVFNKQSETSIAVIGEKLNGNELASLWQ